MNKNMLEIERKFLVKPHAIEHHFSTIEIIQGYVLKNEHGAVRIRIEKEGTNSPHAFLMSKVKVDVMSNYETVDEISVENAEALIEKFATKVIKKTRYIKIVDGFKWEIDLFYQPNQGLMLAEIELNSPDQKIILPDWIEREVTGEAQYYNANM